MKSAIVAVLLCAGCIFGQTPPLTNNFAAVGASYLPGGTPALSGTGMYARLLSGSSGTYAFTVVDAVPGNTKPFTVTTQTSVGVAQKVFSIGVVPVFIPTSAGVSWTGTNTGWAWSTGALALIPLRPNTTWALMPSARVVKSSVSGGSGYQVIVGLAVGWGW